MVFSLLFSTKSAKMVSTYQGVSRLLPTLFHPILRWRIHMKIIAFGDIHMATDVFKNIPYLDEADYVIVTGDLTNFGHKDDAIAVLDRLRQCNENIFCLAGNLDYSDINDYLDELDINLHNQAKLLSDKICVYGVGGSNTTPFNTPWEFSEEQLQFFADNAFSKAEELIRKRKKETNRELPLLFISHTPPYGCGLDQLRNGSNVGSTAIREHIEKHCPNICITGHIHESRGESRIGSTTLINPGMIADGGHVLITINSTISATLL